MTTAPSSDQEAPEQVLAATGEAPPADSLPVLGMIAYGQLAAFTRLAADAAQAPSLAQRLELSRLAGLALDRLDRVADRVVGLGAELEPVMAPFAGVLVEFDRRTDPSSWWERLLKAYVGYGVSDDFSRVVAGATDPTTRALVEDVLGDEGHVAIAVDSIAQAAAQDPTLAPRLALWGRRLVGEALGVVQSVLAEHAELQELLARVLPGEDPQARLFSLLTADHSRRMERLGLTP